jgi:hypothetical protein
MKRLILVATAILSLVFVACGVRSSQAFYNYDSKIISTELDGSYNIRAFGRGRNAVVAYDEARKQAVYDVLFNGVQSNNSRVSSLKPLMLEVNARERYEDYFNAFFADGGAYRDFTNLHDTRALTENWHNNKLQVLVQVSVTVDRQGLKKKLIEDNILKTH